MIDTSTWNLLVPGLLLLFFLVILIARGFGVIKLEWLNIKSMREMRKIKQETDDPFQEEALEAILEHCKSLNSKWILMESDLSILENTYNLVEKIARSNHPKSSHPV